MADVLKAVSYVTQKAYYGIVINSVDVIRIV